MTCLIDEDNQIDLTTRVANVKVDALLKPALPDALLEPALLAALPTPALLAALLEPGLRAVEPDVALSVASETSLG
jgi:hypothetical protein